MALETANISASTLDGGINDSVTTLDVADGSVFPSAGVFWVRIDDEIIKVGARSGNTLSSLTRGESGGGASAAASHSNGATVTGVLTSQAITQLRADITRWGTHATMDALTDMKSGDTFYFDGSDTPYTKAIYNGSSWDLYYGHYKCTPMVLGDFSWVNQGTATATTVGGAVVLTNPTANLNVRALVKTSPSTPYTVKVLFRTHNLNNGNNDGNSTYAGPVWRESGTGEIAALELRKDLLLVHYWASPTSQSSATSSTAARTNQQDPHWMTLEVDGSGNRSSAISFDGLTYQTWSTQSTDFLTQDQVGFHSHANGSSGYDLVTTILSWEES